jgi:hypothetical protein
MKVYGIRVSGIWYRVGFPEAKISLNGQKVDLIEACSVNGISSRRYTLSLMLYSSRARGMFLL